MIKIPKDDCALCPRLVEFLDKTKKQEPLWHNKPVAPFGAPDAKMLIVGLAPGRGGANRTGRPFTGDGAGDVLYPALLGLGLASGHYDKNRDDDLQLHGVRIVNAVRCLPPQNKPIALEVNNCRQFLLSEFDDNKHLKVIVCLGRISHDSCLRTLGLKLAAHKFGHGAVHDLGDGRRIVDSYHCSRYNMNTGVLSAKMFTQALQTAKSFMQCQ